MTSFRQAVRALVRRPVFTLAVVLTMTAGIGVTTALFSIVDRVLLRPLPFPDGDQLVSVYEASPSRRERLSLVAPARLADWNRLNRTFDAISGSYSESVTDTSGAEPERLEGRRVMPRFFDVFAMPPLVGRTFVDQEERFGGPAAAVISEPFWTRRFARNPAAIGQRLTIGGSGYTIVGVMPRAFTSGLGGTALRAAISIDLWIPAQIAPRLLEIREARFLGAVGRMRPGVTLDQARTDLVARPAAARRAVPGHRQGLGRAGHGSQGDAGRRVSPRAAHDLRRRRFVAADCRRQRRRPDARAAPPARDGARDSQRDRRVAAAGRHGDRARGRAPGDRWRDCRRVRLRYG